MEESELDDESDLSIRFDQWSEMAVRFRRENRDLPLISNGVEILIGEFYSNLHILLDYSEDVTQSQIIKALPDFENWKQRLIEFQLHKQEWGTLFGSRATLAYLVQNRVFGPAKLAKTLNRIIAEELKWFVDWTPNETGSFLDTRECLAAVGYKDEEIEDIILKGIEYLRKGESAFDEEDWPISRNKIKDKLDYLKRRKTP